MFRGILYIYTKCILQSKLNFKYIDTISGGRVEEGSGIDLLAVIYFEERYWEREKGRQRELGTQNIETEIERKKKIERVKERKWKKRVQNEWIMDICSKGGKRGRKNKRFMANSTQGQRTFSLFYPFPFSSISPCLSLSHTSQHSSPFLALCCPISFLCFPNFQMRLPVWSGS